MQDSGSEGGTLTPTASLASTPMGRAPSASTQLAWLHGDKAKLVKSGSIRSSFSEVQLGVLVRATPQGRIFRGRWHDSPVAVKVPQLFPPHFLENRKFGIQILNFSLWDVL